MGVAETYVRNTIAPFVDEVFALAFAFNTLSVVRSLALAACRKLAFCAWILCLLFAHIINEKMHTLSSMLPVAAVLFLPAFPQVMLQNVSFTSNQVKYTASNVIAVKRGTAHGTTSEEIVVVGAHLDSTAKDSTTRAPGADDNASGSAALLGEPSLLFGPHLPSWRTFFTIMFLCFVAGTVT